MMTVKIIGDSISQKETDAYIDYCRNKYPDRTIKALTIRNDGEFVDLETEFEDVPFERIRRITGYLVGTLDRFNDGKRAEVDDRVKHGT